MKLILATLAFYAKYPGWYSYDYRHRGTVNAIKSLVKRGYLEVNEFHQAKYTGKTFQVSH